MRARFELLESGSKTAIWKKCQRRTCRTSEIAEASNDIDVDSAGTLTVHRHEPWVQTSVFASGGRAEPMNPGREDFGSLDS